MAVGVKTSLSVYLSLFLLFLSYFLLPPSYKSGSQLHNGCLHVNKKTSLILRRIKFKWLNGEYYVQNYPEHVSMQMWYLRMATVRASGEVAHGQITSGFRPWDWNTFRKASHDDTDPDNKEWIKKTLTKQGRNSQNSQPNMLKCLYVVVLYYKETMFVQDKWLTRVRSISHNKHTYGGQVGVPLIFVGHHGPVEVTALHQGHTCYQRARGICYIWCTYIL